MWRLGGSGIGGAAAGGMVGTGGTPGTGGATGTGGTLGTGGTAPTTVSFDGLAGVLLCTGDGTLQNAGTLAIPRGKGDGTFESFRVFSTGMGPHSVDIADLDSDGTPDLTVANKDDASVSVLLDTSY